MTYIAELEENPQLADELVRRLQGREDRNPTMPFGRRIGWYAAARIVRPRLIVETGVHDGLGSTALLQALEMNDRDGSPGELISFEVDTAAGWLIPDRLRSRQRIVFGDSLAQMPIVLDGQRVDMFIHDSDHRYEHEAAEFETVANHLNPRTVLISDNAHGCTAFADFCDRQGFPFRFWRERPLGHFYPGAGIGLTVVP
jgi:predicted O-methyltransferase YrrM